MDAKTKITLYSLSFLLLGIAAGWLAFSPKEDPHASTMHGAMESMTASLAGKTGSEFDKAFLREMVVHHEGAVEMANQVLVASERPELRALAEDIIAAQTKEISQMRAWQDAWFGK